MKRSRFSEEQIITILREAEAGATAKEVCRRHGISEQSFEAWRVHYNERRPHSAIGYMTPLAATESKPMLNNNPLTF